MLVVPALCACGPSENWVKTPNRKANMPPDPLAWFLCPQNYCGQYFEFNTSRFNTQVVCPNCQTAYLGEESDDPPEPPELLAKAGKAESVKTKATGRTK